ncbi:2,3-diaminopropionate biosynthesis protein SbnB [[Flexibacter] sp. ATCC 35103]|uniref:2,3-diaminopropionate biosynthesis protein SbnB n=1 Tax=[Flexibacter] sp. ATCC 35103 TaxID=1937528 RepID=UPI0009C1BEF6|nr:2,3-diaminopropionate biosynthesis protein SbnB [[Flexibacter] sp. ATCC 35103]AQX14489.1 SbnB [[Flexibacter] sp. ATCC 35103]OMQ08166.1 2,3-diaminopropionate biosynthesis protein SbnB [[Flexibacter] sp. ATCC 35103]
MIFLDKADVLRIPRQWNELLDTIEETVHILSNNDFSQPIKPYLRFGDPANRIIAMPAFVGGDIDMAGIKWIASFPKNINKGIARANSVTILNNSNTGEPVCIINSTLISEVRTAAVSGTMIRKFLEVSKGGKLKIGIVGFGPIGQRHLEMIDALFSDQIETVFLYDINKVDEEKIPASIASKVIIANSWQDTFETADIFITATVSSDRYIDLVPKKGSLHLNISLRDYQPEVINHINYMVVDNWEEICRENTDIEIMHKKYNLNKENTLNLIDVFTQNALSKFKEDEVIMFNPMGMAIFDISIAKYFYKKAI